MILIEGPDNSGKTTLLNKLKKDLKLREYKRPHGAPKTPEDLLRRAILVSFKEANKNYIMDRHPLIGEVIYGSILRGENKWDYLKDEYKVLNELFLDHINKGKLFLIYCRPPTEVVLNLKTHVVKDYDTKEHLEALANNSEKILREYDKKIEPIANHVYNYTDTNQYQYLINHIKGEYLNERE